MMMIKEGDIVEHTGGYNCTQTQFFTVTAISKTGKKVLLRRLKTTQVFGYWMNGTIAPVPGTESGETNEVMVKEDHLRGRINRGSLENFYKWNGKPVWNICD